MYIVEDTRNRIDLAFSWLYEEYAVYHGFTLSPLPETEKVLTSYDRCFNKLIYGLTDKAEAKDVEM